MKTGIIITLVLILIITVSLCVSQTVDTVTTTIPDKTTTTYEEGSALDIIENAIREKLTQEGT